MHTQTITIATPALFILQRIMQAGFEAYIVGGAVRDALRDQEIGQTEPWHTDYDITTDATPEQILQLFPESFYENVFGTVMWPFADTVDLMGVNVDLFYQQLATKPIKKSGFIELAEANKIHTSLQNAIETPENKKPALLVPNYEITTFRSDGTYHDARRPSSVTWGKSLAADVARRDFTINALAVQISADTLSNIDYTQPTTELSAEQYQILDYHQGLADLAAHTLKTVGDPNQRFEEDALRMLRAIRFSVQLNLNIEPATLNAITTHAELITKISWERIRDEFLKMLQSPYPAEAIKLLDQTGLLSFILPELVRSKGVAQGGHHTTDVWIHSLDALRECPSPDPIVRLATLLHDIAKPETYAVRNQSITFYNHEIIGSRIAKSIARRLKLSNHDCDRMFTLVRYHMFHYQPHNTDAAIRRFMRKVGLENIDDILDLREADRLGSGARKTSWRLEEMKQRMIEQLNQPLDVTDLAINGNDLINTLKLEPGPVIGKILSALFEHVLDHPEDNQKEKLLPIAEKIWHQQSE